MLQKIHQAYSIQTLPQLTTHTNKLGEFLSRQLQKPWKNSSLFIISFAKLYKSLKPHQIRDNIQHYKSSKHTCTPQYPPSSYK